MYKRQGEYQVETIRPPQDWRITLLEELFGAMGPVLKQGNLSPLLGWLRRVENSLDLGWLSDPKGIHAYCFCVPDTGGSAF